MLQPCLTGQWVLPYAGLAHQTSAAFSLLCLLQWFLFFIAPPNQLPPPTVSFQAFLPPVSYMTAACLLRCCQHPLFDGALPYFDSSSSSSQFCFAVSLYTPIYIYIYISIYLNNIPTHPHARTCNATIMNHRRVLWMQCGSSCKTRRKQCLSLLSSINLLPLHIAVNFKKAFKVSFSV